MSVNLFIIALMISGGLLTLSIYVNRKTPDKGPIKQRGGKRDESPSV